MPPKPVFVLTIVPDELNLTFVGSYFQPYMALDTATRNKFEIKEVTGSEKWNLTELVSNSSPSVTFTIKNPNKSRKITHQEHLPRQEWLR